MSPLEGALLVFGFLAVLVTLAALLMGLELLVPGVSRWLDDQMPETPWWDR